MFIELGAIAAWTYVNHPRAGGTGIQSRPEVAARERLSAALPLCLWRARYGNHTPSLESREKMFVEGQERHVPGAYSPLCDRALLASQRAVPFSPGLTRNRRSASSCPPLDGQLTLYL